MTVHDTENVILIGWISHFCLEHLSSGTWSKSSCIDGSKVTPVCTDLYICCLYMHSEHGIRTNFAFPLLTLQAKQNSIRNPEMSEDEKSIVAVEVILE
jgi:hypothetical protein